MRFGVLGPLAIWTADGGSVRVPELKVRALLADLLIHEGRPVSADQLVDDLWGERPPANPTGALQTKVWHLRKAMDAAEPGARDLLWSGPAGYRLRAEPDAVDAGRFAALTRRARATGDARARARLLADALALWRGPALADFADEPFATASIAKLTEQRLTAREDYAEARLELGEHAELTAELDDLVAAHPLRERLRAAQLRALYRAGRQGAALESFADLRERLADQLGADPSPELTALHQAILRQDPALAPRAPARQGNLPAPLTGLVGRAEAVTEVCTLLGEHRLVTLTGSGGVGKTRLAIEAATELAGTFPDGAWLVELGTVTDLFGPGELCSLADAVMKALDIHDDGTPVPMTDRLGAALRGRRPLLVLDNCEHLAGKAAELANRLLGDCAGLRILATSQDTLGLAGEALYTVAPLAGADAVRLFAARAAAAAPGFGIDGGNSADVELLCDRLDGIPLALELAAGRVRTLGVRGLLDRLDDRFRLLTAGHRGAPARQRTLRATIEWSWGLLTDDERVLLGRLAVHTGGCTLEAAEHVCSGAGLAEPDVLDLLTRLVDRSLVVADERAGRVRYRLLESVREYGLGRLRSAGEESTLRRRHAGYYTGLAERADPQLRGPDQRAWLDRLDAESANLVAALDTLLAGDDRATALRLVNALAWYRYLRGRLTEAMGSLRRALDGADPGTDGAAEAVTWQAGLGLIAGNPAGRPRLAEATAALPRITDPVRGARARWLLGFARTTTGDGDLAGCAELVDGALAGFRDAGDRWGEAAALTARALVAMVGGDLPAMRADGAAGHALFGEVGDRWGQSQAGSALATLAEISGDYERASRLLSEGLRIADELGLWPDKADRLSGLGRIALLRGDHARAAEYHEQGRRLAADQAYKAGELFALIGLGLGARREGRLDVAETHLRVMLDWDAALPADGASAVPLALVYAELGFVAELRGDAAAAVARHEQALAIAGKLGDRRAVALALEGLAGARALAGEPAEAARLLGMAAAERDAAGAPLPDAERGDVDRIGAAARTSLGEDEFAAAFEAGYSSSST